MNPLIPEGFKELRVSDDFVGLIGPLWFKAEDDKLRVGLPLEPRHGNPMGWAHGGLLVTVADMVMGAGSGHATGIRWPHPTISPPHTRSQVQKQKLTVRRAMRAVPSSH